MLIPAPALAEAARAATDDPVSLHVLTGGDGEPAIAGLSCGDKAIITRLAAGDHPDIAKLIAAAFSATRHRRRPRAGHRRLSSLPPLDALTAASAGRARSALTTPARAGLITPAGDGGQDDTGPAYRHLLMPIRSAG